MHPLDAPLTARQFPSEFRNYTFAEPIIASFKDASGSRCRAIIARMELQTGPEDGATAKIDMYVTGSDLARCKHPQAKEINDKLIEAHNSQPHAAPQTQTEVRQVQTSASMSAQV